MIDRATVDKIMDATDIVDVVSEFVSLRKAGVNYKGLCPFHDDKTPSFMVSPTKQICHCFACGKGGNAVNFLMEHEQITYPEALRWLAKKYSIEIQERELSVEEKQEQSERESMFIVNEWAKDYFHHILLDHEDGRAIGLQYFRSRSIRDDIIEKFQLGFALPKRDSLSTAALQKGYKEEFLVKTGLCYRREDPPALVDRYAGRVIFPWFNVSGKVVAFGGRLLDSRTKGVQQKYVNSPDSEIYHKERELYGLYQAKRAIAKEDRVFMVEGYTDVIAMHQSGIENVVANSGTALSIHQIHILHRFTENIVLLYDGDEAGIHAAMRGTDMLLAEGMNLKVLLLPDGDDPDSFSRKHSADELRQYIEEHQTDFMQFKTDMMLRGVTDPIKRSEAVSSIIKSISVIPNQIIRDTYLHECSTRLQLNEQTLISTMNNFIRSGREEKLREDERNERRNERLQSQTYPAAGTSASAIASPSGAIPAPPASAVAEAPQSPSALIFSQLFTHENDKIERLLVQAIVRHGGEVMMDGVETEDGQLISLTVAQFVDIDFANDDLHFSNPLYTQILAEAVAHSGEPDFDSDAYFLRHPDVNISRLATELSVNKYQLSKGLAIQEKPVTIRSKVEHLVLDFRMNIVKQRLKDVQNQLRQVGSDMEQIKQLMAQYKDVQLLRDQLARQLGNDVIAN
jgi:DNA primase